jgi:hypothetical protein
MGFFGDFSGRKAREIQEVKSLPIENHLAVTGLHCGNAAATEQQE